VLGKPISYRFKQFIQRFLAAIAAVIFISSDLFLPAATQAFVPAAPSLAAFVGDVVLLGTAAELATIAAPIIVGGFVIGVAYYYWSQQQTTQAQALAQQKYCIANPVDQLCVPPPFTGGQSINTLYEVWVGAIPFNDAASGESNGVRYAPFQLYGPIVNYRIEPYHSDEVMLGVTNTAGDYPCRRFYFSVNQTYKIINNCELMVCQITAVIHHLPVI
jgi:hypothetical protein